MTPYFWIPKPDYRPAKTSVLEKWYGREALERVSLGMKNWYGPPVALTHMPGNVVSLKGGDFAGQIFGNRFADPFYRGIANGVFKAGLALQGKFQKAAFGTGFTSLSDLIAEATAGKRRDFFFNKSIGTAPGTTGESVSLLQLGPMPAAAANATGAAGGDVPVDSTTGWPTFGNPTGGDTQHIVSATASSNNNNRTLLLYDCLFRVNKTMNSVATEAVTGVPTRYQSTTAGAADSAEGNFLFIQVGQTVLAATAHNWTVCQYTDQSGNPTITLPSIAGQSAAAIHSLDMPVNQWFCPLATDDTGIQKLTQMQCSATVATGVINFVIGHPLAWMMFPIANLSIPFDYISTAFNLARIFDDAALSLMDVMQPSSSTGVFNVQVTTVSG